MLQLKPMVPWVSPIVRNPPHLYQMAFCINILWAKCNVRCLHEGRGIWVYPSFSAHDPFWGVGPLFQTHRNTQKYPNIRLMMIIGCLTDIPFGHSHSYGSRGPFIDDYLVNIFKHGDVQ